MSDSSLEGAGFSFEGFIFDSVAGELRHGERIIALRPKSMALLTLLVRHPRRLFARDELIRELWPGVFVSDETLSQHVSLLRRALRPFAGLTTVPRRGYRFDADVVRLDDPIAPSTEPPEAPTPSRLAQRVSLDAFVGRDAELQLLARLVQAHRIVTVLGFGGVGKTRLVVRFAQTRSDGVWFCDLSESRDEHGVVGAVGRALGVPLRPGQSVEQLGHAIAGRARCLIVLDNVEQVADVVAPMLVRWATTARQATFLLTSRAPLRIAGEQTLWLEPLDVEGSRALFVERALAVSPGRRLDDAEVDAITAAVDGLPLAIELAAARVRVLTLPQLQTQLAERRSVLATTKRGVPDRQATIRATLDWSWTLLSASEQRLLRQLSVFEGGFELWAVEAVHDDADALAIDVLQSLVEQSLVRARDGRFSLLATVADYASSKLDDARERRVTEQGHGETFLAWAHAPSTSPGDLSRELGNLIVACQRAIRRGEGTLGVELLGVVGPQLGQQGPIALVCELAQRLDVLDLSDDLRAARDEIWGEALRIMGRWQAASERMESSLAFCVSRADLAGRARIGRRLGALDAVMGRLDQAERRFVAAAKQFAALKDPRGEAETRWCWASLEQQRARFAEAEAQLEQALHLVRPIDAPRLEALILGNLGTLHLHRASSDRAEEHFAAALALRGDGQDAAYESVLVGNLAILRGEQGRYDEAQAFFERALRLRREVGDRRVEGDLLGNIGVLRLYQKQWDDGYDYLMRALAIHREVANRRAEAFALVNLSDAHERRGNVAAALASARQAVAIHREHDYPRVGGVALGCLGSLLALKGQRDEAARCWDEAEGMLRQAEDVYQLAKLLALRAEIEAQWGLRAEAQHHLHAAATIADGLKQRIHDDLQGALDAARAALFE